MSADGAGTSVSYCVQCDALPDQCEHDGPRYLDEIMYERAGKTWRVPLRDRARYERPVYGVFRVKSASSREPKPIHQIVVELEAWVDLDPTLEQTLRACYDVNPAKVTALSDKIIDGCSRGGLRSPGGFLFKRLGQLALSNGH